VQTFRSRGKGGLKRTNLETPRGRIEEKSTGQMAGEALKDEGKKEKGGKERRTQTEHLGGWGEEKGALRLGGGSRKNVRDRRGEGPKKNRNYLPRKRK